MPMSDGRTALKKIEFEIGNKTFKFAINPENYTHRKPHRTTAVKTKSRIVIEDFQEDISTITIRGTTGFNPTGRAEDRGIAKIKEMKAYLEEYANAGGNGNTPAQEFYFHNYTNDESFVVHLSPEGVTYTQDVQYPLMYRYEISFTVLRKAGEPSDDAIINPEIGNRFPSIPNGQGRLQNPYPTNPNGGTQSQSPSQSYPYGPRQGNGNIYATSRNSSDPINPQAPSVMSYTTGTTALGVELGYYGRWLT